MLHEAFVIIILCVVQYFRRPGSDGLVAGLDYIEPGIIPVGRWRAGEPVTGPILTRVAHRPVGWDVLRGVRRVHGYSR